MNETANFTTPNVAPFPATEAETGFIDRRGSLPVEGVPTRERRQFTNSYNELSPEAAELAQAIDEYKSRHRRRFINYEEVLGVMKTLGYSR